RKVAQTKFHCLDEALVGKRYEISSIFHRQPGSGGGNIQKRTLSIQHRTLTQHEPVQHEMQICVLNGIRARAGISTHDDRVAVAEVSEIRPRANQRLHVHRKAASIRLGNFPKVRVRYRHTPVQSSPSANPDALPDRSPPELSGSRQSLARPAEADRNRPAIRMPEED